jgi:hypothetical protein
VLFFCQLGRTPGYRRKIERQLITWRSEMPKFLIEREIPNAGSLSGADLQGIAAKSCDVLQKLGPSIQWVESYVTDNKIYCVYIAPDADLVRRHAAAGGFPANSVSEIRTTIDPTTSERRFA